MALILVQKYGVSFVLSVDSPPLVLSSNLDTLAQPDLAHANVNPGSRGGGVLSHMGYIGMCGAKGYGFLVVLV